ncbi:MAG: hypothetical protein WEF28_06755, partial [Acidimicrobiia bacterium]
MDVVSSMVVDVLEEPPLVVDVLDPTDVEVEPEASDVVVLSPAVLLVEPPEVVDGESVAIELETTDDTTDDEVVEVAASLDAHATPTTTRPAATAVTTPSIFLSISGTSFGTSPISEIPAQARFSSPSRFPQASFQRPQTASLPPLAGAFPPTELALPARGTSPSFLHPPTGGRRNLPPASGRTAKTRR